MAVQAVTNPFIFSLVARPYGFLPTVEIHVAFFAIR
jgi:hypothetical protein